MTLSFILMGPLLWMAVFGGVTKRLIALGIATSLADAALINIGVSINLNWLMMLFMVGWFMLELRYLPPPAGLMRRAFDQVLPVIWLWVWNAALIMSAPLIFTHIRETMPGSSEFDPRLAVPLSPQGESFNQEVYLLVAIIASCVIAITLAREPARMMERINYLLTAMFAAAALWFFWHVASINLGVPFPGALLHNDASSKAWLQRLGGVYRPSGSMPEPSSVAAFFLPFPFYFFERYLAMRNWRLLIPILLALGVLFFSTSTTAYAGIALFVFWMAVRGLGGGGALLTGAKVSLRDIGAFAALCGLLAVGAAGVWIFLVDPTVAEQIFREQILEKSTSMSARQRGYANELGLDIFFQSYGVGVGMGNHRTSSIVLALLSGTGIIGLALMTLFIGQISWQAMTRGRRLGQLYARQSFAVVAGFGAIMLAGVMIGGELQNVQMWIWAGCLIAMNIAPLPSRAPARRPVPRPSPTAGVGVRR